MRGHLITSFEENRAGRAGSRRILVASAKVLDLYPGDETLWEREPMERLAREGELAAYLHRGFWHPMDTLRDKNYRGPVERGRRAVEEMVSGAPDARN